MPQELHGGIQRTPHSPLWPRLLLCHIFTVTYFHLHFTSKMGTLHFVILGILCRAYKEGYEQSTRTGWHTQRRVRPGLRRQARKEASQRPALSWLGHLPPQ